MESFISALQTNITTLLLAALILILIILYAIANKKIQKLEEEKKTSDTKLSEDKEKIIEKARLKGEEMLSEASKKAMDILSETDNFNNDSKVKLQAYFEKALKNQAEAIDEVGKTLLREYQKQLNSIKNDNINTAHNISKGLEQDLQEKTKKEVEEYKKAQLAKLDSQIYEILAIVSENVFGPGIKLDKHEELVLEALEKAKKEISGIPHE